MLLPAAAYARMGLHVWELCLVGMFRASKNLMAGTADPCWYMGPVHNANPETPGLNLISCCKKT